MSLVTAIIGSLANLILFISGILSAMSAYYLGKGNSSNPDIKTARSLMIWTSVIIWLGFVICVGLSIFAYISTRQKAVVEKVPDILLGGKYGAPLVKGIAKDVSKTYAIILGGLFFVLGLIGGILSLIAYADVKKTNPAINSDAETAQTLALWTSILLGLVALIGLGIVIYSFIAKTPGQKEIEAGISEEAARIKAGQVALAQQRAATAKDILESPGEAFLEPSQGAVNALVSNVLSSRQIPPIKPIGAY